MRKFLIGLIGLCFISGLLLAQIPEENFQKAVQRELEWREADLSMWGGWIEEFFDEMVWITDSDCDLNISGKEMKELKKRVKLFDKKKKKRDKELEFYEVKTTTEIKPVIREHLKIYFEFSNKKQELWFGDNKNQDIRRDRIGQIGYDVTVEKSRNYGRRSFLGLFFGAVLGLLIAGFIEDRFKSTKVGLRVGFDVLVIILLIFLIV